VCNRISTTHVTIITNSRSIRVHTMIEYAITKVVVTISIERGFFWIVSKFHGIAWKTMNVDIVT